MTAIIDHRKNREGYKVSSSRRRNNRCGKDDADSPPKWQGELHSEERLGFPGLARLPRLWKRQNGMGCLGQVAKISTTGNACDRHNLKKGTRWKYLL
jgi:hypothetical protein